MVLFIFHALYMCLTAEEFYKTEKVNRDGPCVSMTYRSKSIIDTHAINF